jgi:hypothetical protein
MKLLKQTLTNNATTKKKLRKTQIDEILDLKVLLSEYTINKENLIILVK